MVLVSGGAGKIKNQVNAGRYFSIKKICGYGKQRVHVEKTGGKSCKIKTTVMILTQPFFK